MRKPLELHDEAVYVCESCGEDIVVPVDPTAGGDQEYVEDCPVCCHPNVIHVHIGDRGDVEASGHCESDLF